MRYEEILNRDVPTIKAHSQSWARQGVMAPIRIYYKHEAIAWRIDGDELRHGSRWVERQRDRDSRERRVQPILELPLSAAWKHSAVWLGPL